MLGFIDMTNLAILFESPSSRNHKNCKSSGSLTSITDRNHDAANLAELFRFLTLRNYNDPQSTVFACHCNHAETLDPSNPQNLVKPGRHVKNGPFSKNTNHDLKF